MKDKKNRIKNNGLPETLKRGDLTLMSVVAIKLSDMEVAVPAVVISNPESTARLNHDGKFYYAVMLMDRQSICVSSTDILAKIGDLFDNACPIPTMFEYWQQQNRLFSEESRAAADALFESTPDELAEAFKQQTFKP